MATAKIKLLRAGDVVPNPISPVGQKKAKQEFKQDADINSIMQKFQKTQTINYAAKHQPQYGIATPVDYHQALNIVTAAQSMFAELPSNLRRRFENKPEALLEFVQDEANYQEATELGLRLTDAAEQAALARLERADPDEGPNAGQGEEGTSPTPSEGT